MLLVGRLILVGTRTGVLNIFDAATQDDSKPGQLCFEDWWSTDGRYIDPDTEDVPWFDKRKELAALAFIAGRKSK